VGNRKIPTYSTYHVQLQQFQVWISLITVVDLKKNMPQNIDLKKIWIISWLKIKLLYQLTVLT